MENPAQDKSSWLQELSNQSWNLELVVSGAAIFSTSFLPDLTEQALSYYFENYQPNNASANYLFPTLAYSFAKAASYLLIVTFFLHFILRAFWIAMVGLRAVFPQGINYENLPNTNGELKEVIRKRLGRLDDYIVRLDKICSQIFSIAFLLVLFSAMIAIVYLLVFLLIVALKTYYPEIYHSVKIVLLIAMGMWYFFMFIGLIIGSKEKYREHPFWGKLLKMIILSNSYMYFGMYKPINHIGLVFASNLPRKRYYLFTSLFAISFLIAAMTIYTQQLSQNNEVPFFESRNYYSSGSTDHRLKSDFYDNLRTIDADIWEASIQSDVIQEPFIKLFINYNKVLDAHLVKIYKEPKIPENLDKYKKRSIKDKARLDAFREYFQIALNDSTLHSTEFMYDEHGAVKTKGLSTYLSTEKCKIGRNTLYIKALQTDSLPRKVWAEYISIPFWYAKD